MSLGSTNILNGLMGMQVKYLMTLTNGKDSSVVATSANQPFSIAVVAPFSGLCCFPKGRGFKQWTGDDSKAFMKVSDLYSSTPNVDVNIFSPRSFYQL